MALGEDSEQIVVGLRDPLANGPLLSGTTAEPTPTGLAVLNGTTNALDLNPVNEWVGGVHLDTTEAGVWVTGAGPNALDELPNQDLQLTWRGLGERKKQPKGGR